LLVRAASAYPDDAHVQATYGEVLLAIGSPEYRARAKQALQRAVSLGSKSPTVRRRLAKLLIEDGDAAGFGLLREAIQLEPYNIDVYLQLARAQLAIGQRSEAAKTLEQALSFEPGNPDARRLLRELPP
jgi:cytochrome c-type biogenesis protein CcmH/NrfG